MCNGRMHERATEHRTELADPATPPVLGTGFTIDDSAVVDVYDDRRI